MPKYPNITAKIVGEDGNAFSILGTTMRALKRGKASMEDIASFQEEAMSGDYDHLLATVMDYVEVA
ncbi:hypothetical protein KAR91_84710 [Candidatus Pacearchaeota archaeon]|nr:hypothetical protein [Candidatus Pacearchaeota archaeon]